MTVGIYCIENTINGKKYIGKSKDIDNRIRQHRHYLRKDAHDTKRVNPLLYNAVQKYGWDKFSCYVLESFERVDENLIRDRELYWIDHYNTTEVAFGYNLRRDSRTGMVVHYNTRRKISERLKKEWSCGVRDGHSDKLKAAWAKSESRHGEQARLLTKIKTKYEYALYLDCAVVYCYYEDLCKYGFKSALSAFHRKGSDMVLCKGVWIERKIVEPLQNNP